MKLTPKEEKITRLALDDGAHEGERAAAALKLIESLRARGVSVEDLQEDAPSPPPFSQKEAYCRYWDERLAAAPTREAELRIYEESCNSLWHESGMDDLKGGGLAAEFSDFKKGRERINRKWDRLERPRQPMTEADHAIVNAIIRAAHQLPRYYAGHILWSPATQTLAWIFEKDECLDNLNVSVQHIEDIVKRLQVPGVKDLEVIPYSSDGPPNAPFQIEEAWLKENGWWFFVGPFSGKGLGI